MNVDFYAIVFQEAVLFLILLTAFFKSVNARIKKRRGNLHLTVTRGEKSMKNIHTWFGISSVLVTLTIQVADAFEGFKVLIVLANYLILFVLFFGSGWFRNNVLIPLVSKTEVD